MDLKFLAKISIFLIMVISIDASSASFNVREEVDVDEEFQKYTLQAIKKWKIPGLAYAIVRDGNIVAIKTFGVREIGKIEEINKNTIFRIASLSKTFTATLLAKLSLEDKIDLKRPLKNYIPELSFANDNYTEDITLHHVLTHSTGLPARALEEEIQNEELNESSLLSLTKKINFDAAPGKYSSYQNAIYNFTSMVVSKIKNETFTDIMKKEIFQPLNLKDSSVGAAPYISSNNKAVPHHFEDGKYIYLEENLVSKYYKVAAAAGVNSSIEDMAKWLIAQMGYREEVISDEVLKVTQKEYTKDEDFMRWTSWNKNTVLSASYGLGWRIHNYAGKQVVTHSGGLKGFSNYIAFIPSQDTGIVIISNASSPVPSFLVAKFLDLNFGLPYQDYSSIHYQQR